MTLEESTRPEITARNVQTGPIQAYFARPTQGENLPGVIIIHEIFGLNDNIRDIAQRFAEAGYAALAVDLFSHGSNRALCITRVILGMLRNPLKSFSMYDLDAAMRFLKSQPEIASEQIGLIGFCLGGGFALAFAVHSDEVRAASVFYGLPPKPLNTLQEACPIVASYGADDKFVTRRGEKAVEALRQYGRPVDFKVYEGAGHSFFNDRAKTYRPNAAADAWERTLAWFKEYLPQKTEV